MARAEWRPPHGCGAPPTVKRPSAQSSTLRSRRALRITETELSVMATLAIMGLSRMRRTDRAPGGDRHAEGVVEEGEGEVLADVGHGGPAEPVARTTPRRSPRTRVMPALSHGDVGAGPHGDADVGLGQRRGVVDPVAGHGDDAALGLEPLDLLGLLVGEHLGADLVEPEPRARRPRPTCGCRR